MSERSPERLTAIVFLATAGVLVGSLALIYWIGLAAVKSNRELAQHRELSEHLVRLGSTLIDAETGQRGYLLTGEASYLEPYHRALETIEGELEQVSRMADQGDLPSQPVSNVRRLSGEKLAELAQTIKLRQEGDVEGALAIVRSNRGKEVEDSIRSELATLEAAEVVKFHAASRQAKETIRERNWAFLATVLLNLGFLVWVRGRITHEMQGREAARKEVHASEERLRIFIDHAPAAIAMFDTQMRYLAVSQRWLADYGLSGAKVMGRSHYELLPEIPDRWKQVHRRCLAGAVESADEDLFQRADGKRQWVRWEGRPWHFAPGVVGGIIIFSEEITARKRAEASLQQLTDELELRIQQRTAELQAVNRELNDFAFIVSHDLKAPLRGVTTLADWLIQDNAAQLDAQGRQRLAEMERRIARMNRMIEEILHYSRLGRTEENPEDVSLARLLPEIVQDLAPPPSAQIDIAPGLPVVQGEPVRLRQVFQNLIGNAIKYADKPSIEIHVAWTQTDSLWEFTVADNGPGIEEVHFERIFKMFQSLAPKDKTDSTGVGLALVKRIVERAGGHVWVESCLGQSSTFHFTWPKDTSPSSAEAATKLEYVAK